MLSIQNFSCAICGGNDFERIGRVLSVDHDHKTGKVRGLLCLTCNSGLGIFKDDPVLLKKASSYLEEHSVRR